MAYSRDSSGSGWCRRKKFRPHWSHVRMPCIFIGCFIDQAQLDSHDGRTQWGICLARRKISNMFDFFLTASRGQFLTKSSPHTVRKRLSKPPREAVCSALSSPCAASFNHELCFLFARTPLKEEGFFASNSKYFVCFNKFYAGNGFCDIFRPNELPKIKLLIDL